MRQIHKTITTAIPGYRYIKDIKEVGSKNKYSFALYQSSGKKFAFAKIWRGILPNQNYYWLRNEIIFYKKLFSNKRSSVIMQKDNKKITVPTLRYSFIGSRKLILLLEYIPGKTLHNLTPSQKVSLLSLALSFIKHKNSVLSKNSKSFPSRPAFYWVLIFPFVWIIAFIRHPQLSALLFRSLSYYVTHIRAILRYKQRTLVHRDLGEDNIMLLKKKTILIDFQLCSIMHPVVDIVVVLMKQWHDKEFTRQFIQENSEVHSEVFRIYGVILSVYDLSLTDGRPIADVADFLEYNLGVYNTSLYIQALKDNIYNHFLDNHKKVTCNPYDPKVELVAKKIISRIKKTIPGVSVHFIGSAALKIAGQNDIDIVIETDTNLINTHTLLLSADFGSPTKQRSNFTEWKFSRSGYEIEISLVNKKNSLFKERIAVFSLLKNNSYLLGQYSELKRKSNGMGLRDYELAKGQFLNLLRGIS